VQNSLQRTLSLIKQHNVHATFSGITKGIEKESLRITNDGRLAQTPHPTALGSALTHPSITTDYSEALLEFITPTYTDTPQLLNHLDKIHRYTFESMGEEKLWVNSMPCALESELDIPIAEYGSSNIGQMKHVYRHGLWHRYGRRMQTIAGIHYNVSMPTTFWQEYQKALGNHDPLQDFISTHYFKLIRNFHRYVGLLIYVFGASPAICRCFLKDREHHLEDYDESTLYLPYGTSLRMGDFGYQNDAQADLNISYSSLDEYVADLGHAIHTPHAPYQAISDAEHDCLPQLNGNILQIENEYYSSIRPKRTAHSGERPTRALADRGVEYIEMRCLDLNPFEPLGINEESILFLDVFATFCLLESSPSISASEKSRLDHNRNLIINEGRKPGLMLQESNGDIAFTDWGNQLIEKLSSVALLLDEANQTDAYSKSVASQQAKINDASLTPSAQILSTLKTDHGTFYDFAMNKAQAHKQYFKTPPLNEEDAVHFKAQATKSLEQQHEIEVSDTLSFDQYLSNYFSDASQCE